MYFLPFNFEGEEGGSQEMDAETTLRNPDNAGLRTDLQQIYGCTCPDKIDGEA